MGELSKPRTKILVADDEKAILKGLVHLFNNNFSQLEVMEATNGIEAFGIIQANLDLKLAFVDIRMPGLNGLELCKKIKDAGINIKIIILSGFSDHEYARTALRLGVYDYLLKPINPTDALRIVSDSFSEVNLPKVQESHESDESLRKIVEKLKSWIHDHLDRDIKLTKIAIDLHYSPNYLSALFKRETGKGFQEYLTECRMQRAAYLLSDPSLRIYEIAIRVGYTNAKAFSIAFRICYGLTPSEYRESRYRR